MAYYNVTNRNQIEGFDSLVTRYFGETNDGFVLDVGAHDGKRWSNSWPLTTAGWGGLLIEPHPIFVGKIKRLYRGRGDITVVESAVSDYKGQTLLYCGGSLSTIQPEIIKGYKEVSWAAPYWKGQRKGVAPKQLTVQVDTLDNILEQHNIEPGFEVFTLDCEGSEEQVLNKFNISKWAPQMVIVETLEGSGAKGTPFYRDPSERAKLDMMKGEFYKWCENLFKSHQYFKAHIDHINTIYTSPALGEGISP